jgi:hypothetical protein
MMPVRSSLRDTMHVRSTQNRVRSSWKLFVGEAVHGNYHRLLRNSTLKIRPELTEHASRTTCCKTTWEKKKRPSHAWSQPCTKKNTLFLWHTVPFLCGVSVCLSYRGESREREVSEVQKEKCRKRGLDFFRNSRGEGVHVRERVSESTVVCPVQEVCVSQSVVVVCSGGMEGGLKKQCFQCVATTKTNILHRVSKVEAR